MTSKMVNISKKLFIEYYPQKYWESITRLPKCFFSIWHSEKATSDTGYVSQYPLLYWNLIISIERYNDFKFMGYVPLLYAHVWY